MVVGLFICFFYRFRSRATVFRDLACHLGVIIKAERFQTFRVSTSQGGIESKRFSLYLSW